MREHSLFLVPLRRKSVRDANVSSIGAWRQDRLSAGFAYRLHPRLSHVVHLRCTVSKRQSRIANLEFRVLRSVTYVWLRRRHSLFTSFHSPLTTLCCRRDPKFLRHERVECGWRGHLSVWRGACRFRRGQAVRVPKPAVLRPGPGKSEFGGQWISANPLRVRLP